MGLLAMAVSFYLLGGQEHRAVFRPLTDVVSELIPTPERTRISLPNDFKNYQIYFDRGGLSAKQSLAALSTALQASFQSEEGKFVIERTPNELSRIHEARTKLRVKWIEDALDEVDRFRRAHTGTEGSTGSIEAMLKSEASALGDMMLGVPFRSVSVHTSALLPAESLQDQILKRIGSENLAALPSDSTTIYEDSPVGDAKELPDHLDLSAAYADQVASVHAPKLDQRTEWNTKFLFHVPPANARPSIIRFLVWSQSNGCSVECKIFDPSGALVDQDWFRAESSARPMTVTSSPFIDIDRHFHDPGSRTVELSPIAKQTVEFFDNPATKNSPDWIFHPERYEPLNAFVLEAMEALETDTEKPLLVVGADSLWDDCRICIRNGKLNLDALETELRDQSFYERVETPTCVIWRPGDPESVESHGASRVALGKYLRDAISNKGIDLRTAALFYRDGSPSVGPLGAAWDNTATEIVRPGGYQGTRPSERFSQLIGAISDVDWDRLVNGQSLTVAELGIENEAQNLLDEGGPATATSDKIPDLLKEPSETLRVNSIDKMRLVVQPVHALQVVNGGAPFQEPVAWRDPTGFAHPTFIDISKVIFNADGSMRMGITEPEFEHEQDQFGIWRIAEKDGTSVRLYLTPNEYLEASRFVAGINPRMALKFSDLPGDLKRMIWENDCKEAMSAAKKKRQGRS